MIRYLTLTPLLLAGLLMCSPEEEHAPEEPGSCYCPVPTEMTEETARYPTVTTLECACSRRDCPSEQDIPDGVRPEECGPITAYVWSSDETGSTYFFRDGVLVGYRSYTDERPGYCGSFVIEVGEVFDCPLRADPSGGAGGEGGAGF